MLSWGPGSLTSFHDYLQDNKVFDYKAANPDTIIIIRFQHPMNWQQDIEASAINRGKEIAAKWSEIAPLDPYVYFCNEMNLHYESGDPFEKQWWYETEEFYEKFSHWVHLQAQTIKDHAPLMKLVTPPFAYGHNEDGVPENGVPTIGWAGYQFMVDTIRDYFDNILTFHGYWHESDLRELYDPDYSTWYAHRWKRILELFKVSYNLDCQMLIDECGNFQANSATFTQQLLDYCYACFEDSRVWAITSFLWTDPTRSPGNLPNSWWQPDMPQFGMSDEQLKYHLQELSKFEIKVPPIEPPPTEPPDPDCNCDIYSDLLTMGEQIEKLDGIKNNLGSEVLNLSLKCR